MLPIPRILMYPPSCIQLSNYFLPPPRKVHRGGQVPDLAAEANWDRYAVASTSWHHFRLRGKEEISPYKKSSKSVRNGAKKAASKEKPQLQFKRIRVTKSTVILIITRFKREKNKAMPRVSASWTPSSRLLVLKVNCLSALLSLIVYLVIIRFRPN